MLPISLLDENIARADGVGSSVEISRANGKLLVLTLGITRTLEQESLEVSVWASPDATDWGVKPLALFPPKSYCGFYSVLLNLSSHQEVRFLRVQWKMNRWNKPVASPLFAFYVEAEESGARVHSHSATGRFHTVAVA